MFEFVIEHVHTKCLHKIYGYDIYSALRSERLDTNYWKEVKTV